MPETPKKSCETEKNRPDGGDNTSWAEDQKEKAYYYDDSHGYEVYDPSEDDPENED